MTSIFYFTNGDIASNLEEFISKLRTIDDGTFKFHLNSSKNDFFNWIKDGLQRDDIAKDIRKIKTKKGLMAKLKKYV